MTKPIYKRQNFNVTPDEEAELYALQNALAAPSVKDALLRATRVMLVLNQEVREGGRLYLENTFGERTRVLLPEIEPLRISEWKYLSPRSKSSKQQLFFKGKRLSAANVWLDMLANNQTIEEAADNWDLPVEAVQEAVRYCEQNSELLTQEAETEKQSLETSGISLVKRTSPK